MNKRLEINCPCGEILVRDPGDDRLELECPTCARINVLPEALSDRKGNQIEIDLAKGDTTALSEPIAGVIREGTLIGPYRIERLVGEGGMGKVFIATDLNLQRRVAIKILSGDLRGKSDFVARFRREARSVARLNHPNIVQIYFTGTHDEIPYYAMEFVDGENLEILLKREGKIDPDVAVDQMIQAAQGLAAAAAEGVIHRDVKPSNMVVEKSGIIKITDFGLAKLASSQSALTMTGTIVGTPWYMSPEQGEGRDIDFRADIYSLGASFYHLLVGMPPFDAKSPVSIILKHINENLDSPDSRNRKIPSGLAAVIRKMMAKSPDNRYGSYKELISDLEALRRGRPPRAVRWTEEGRPIPAAAGGRKPRSYVIEDQAAHGDEEVRLVRCGTVRRILAFGIDIAALHLVFNLFTTLISPLPVWNSIFLGLTFVYFFLGDSKGGITLGKVFFRCRVGDRDGEDLGLIRGFLRTVPIFFILFAVRDLAFCDALAGVWTMMRPDLDHGEIEASINTVRLVCGIWTILCLGWLVMSPAEGGLHDQISGAAYFKRIRKRRLARREAKAEAEILLKARGPKDPMLAAVLSTLFPGLGQFYLGEYLKGFLIMITFYFIIPWLFGIFHAWNKAKSINRQLGVTL